MLRYLVNPYQCSYRAFFPSSECKQYKICLTKFFTLPPELPNVVVGKFLVIYFVWLLQPFTQRRRCEEHKFKGRALHTIYCMRILSFVYFPRNKRSAVFFITSVASACEQRAISSNSFRFLSKRMHDQFRLSLLRVDTTVNLLLDD